MLDVCNNLAHGDILIGFIHFRIGAMLTHDDGLDEMLDKFVAAREEDDSALEKNRLASRDMLRMAKFKPTGRSKPANEYLLRTVSDEAGDGFPRINPIVDVANFFSLTNQIPLSLWDMDQVSADGYCFRYGLPDETYVFNPAGHSIALQDLVVGCALVDGHNSGQPIVNPIKDSAATKTNSESVHFGMALYVPGSVFSEVDVASLIEELTTHLDKVTTSLVSSSAVLAPHTRVIVGA